MIIELGGAMRMFLDLDKSDLIHQLISLIKKLLSNFIKSVLKNKSNMNQNEYLLKIEQNLSFLRHIYQALFFFNHDLKGIWKAHDYKYIVDAQLTEDIFSIYAYLGVKPLELEQLYMYYLRFNRIWLAKRVFKKSDVGDEGMIEDIIGESLIFEELDTSMANELVKNRVPDTFERVMKSYRVSGRDIEVMVELQKINGAIDGLLAE